MEFDWSPLSHERWRDLLREAPRANLLQSWPYAVAARLHDQMMSRRGLIMDGRPDESASCRSRRSSSAPSML